MHYVGPAVLELMTERGKERRHLSVRGDLSRIFNGHVAPREPDKWIADVANDLDLGAEVILLRAWKLWHAAGGPPPPQSDATPPPGPSD